MRINFRLLLFNFIITTTIAFADGMDSLNIENSGIIKPSMVTTHPLGIFMMRIDHNFMTAPPKKFKFTFNTASGNVWLPPMVGYLPKDPTIQQLMRDHVWHTREGLFDKNTMPAKRIQFQADAVIQVIRPEFSWRVAKNQELNVCVPFYSINKGTYPFTILISDKRIENFHSNHKKISGGEDPFGRRYYGFNKVDINYIDENGRSIYINKNTLVLPGAEAHYYYYPRLNTKKLSMNVGVHSGINISEYNRSIDLGISASFIKILVNKSKKTLSLAIGSSLVKNSLIKFANNVLITNRLFICAAECELEYRRKLRNNSSFSVGLNYFIQTPYNKKSDYNISVFTGNRTVTAHWYWAMTQFYIPLETWSMIFTYTKKYSVSVYAKEDLSVNNVPDIQTGIMFQMPLGSTK